VIFYESAVDALGRTLAEKAEKDGIFHRSEGALGIDLSDEDLGFFMLLKSDGNTLYATKDLGLAKTKFEQYQIDRSIYVVGQEQSLHFQQVFATLQRMGFSQAEKCHHLAYGLVTLPEGKMSSRAGNVILCTELQNAMLKYIDSTYMQDRNDWSAQQKQQTAQCIAIAAIKYGMLNQDPNKTITFHQEDWLTSEGNTGPYLLYAYVRIRSAIAAHTLINPDAIDYGTLQHAHEHELLIKLMQWTYTVRYAAEQYRPNTLCRYLYELAKIFHRTYGQCSIKYAASNAQRDARVALFYATAEILQTGLSLLGIPVTEHM